MIKYMKSKVVSYRKLQTRFSYYYDYNFSLIQRLNQLSPIAREWRHLDCGNLEDNMAVTKKKAKKQKTTPTTTNHHKQTNKMENKREKNTV